MDGFYVAKFKVEKRTKGSAGTDSKIADGPVLVDEEFAMNDVKSEGTAVFDSDEDRPYLEGNVEPFNREASIHEFFCCCCRVQTQTDESKGSPTSASNKNKQGASSIHNGGGNNINPFSVSRIYMALFNVCV
jgi:hypothetical protein